MSFLELIIGLDVILWLSIFCLIVLMDTSAAGLPANYQGKQRNDTKKQEVSGISRTTYNLTMGLHKPKHDRWLIVDENYLLEHDIKQRLLQNKKNSVIGHTRGAETVCEELLTVVAENLTRNYPKSFRYCSKPGLRDGSCMENVDRVEIISTGEVFRLTAPFTHKTALEIAAHLTMEDLNILSRSDDGQHVLIASATCFPVGWAVSDRLGWPLYKLHASVPLWQKKLEIPVERFFSKVTSKTNLERTTRFVQVADTQTNLEDILCQLAPLKHDNQPVNATQIIIRSERQTFTKLPKTGVVIFAIF
ncbi:hypothetical protein MMC26_002471 [Xylographa opegraphella]|nr:hypothetical protein [Xylographa opegraphella]